MPNKCLISELSEEQLDELLTYTPSFSDKSLANIKARSLEKINHNERNVRMKKKIRKPLAVAACITIILSMSAAAFGQNVVEYIRALTLGNHASFIIFDGSDEDERNRAERQALIEETQELIDAGINVPSEQMQEVEWLTFIDAEEGKSHFVTDAVLPTYSPAGYDFSHIYYFVESMEELQEYGANMYMSVVFSSGTDEISMQIRFMNEETGFISFASEDVQKIEINGYEALVDTNSVNLLIDDVMYMFYGNDNVDADELIKMAESLS